ncbi:myomegalin-like [Takifugu flavidus]|uniref:myomegalin-like n=1 Tax=Takifugu flavidus TaxID=433684 RepID=UPI00254426C8|nr:myomegalin-like [Takifugu flavidus]
MSGYVYRGRDVGGDAPSWGGISGAAMDFSCVESNKEPQTRSLREFEQHLNDLKKENFSLKLRIYFLEEKVQQKFEESDDDVHKRNIELKVEVESLKKELEEKQQLLDETLSRAERLSRQNEAELQRHLAERQQEVSHVQEVLETKVQLLREEAELARAKAEHMALLADSEAQRRLALERELEKTEDRVMEELTQQKLLPGLQVEELQSREDPLEPLPSSSACVCVSA